MSPTPTPEPITALVERLTAWQTWATERQSSAAGTIALTLAEVAIVLAIIDVDGKRANEKRREGLSDGYQRGLRDGRDTLADDLRALLNVPSRVDMDSAIESATDTRGD